MGKIKGWEKRVDEKGRIVWISDQHNTIDIEETRNYWRLTLFIQNKVPFPSLFDTKQEVTNYAVKYMRANPNG